MTASGTRAAGAGPENRRDLASPAWNDRRHLESRREGPSRLRILRRRSSKTTGETEAIKASTKSKARRLTACEETARIELHRRFLMGCGILVRSPEYSDIEAVLA